jgi:hypothetical protein
MVKCPNIAAGRWQKNHLTLFLYGLANESMGVERGLPVFLEKVQFNWKKTSLEKRGFGEMVGNAAFN